MSERSPPTRGADDGTGPSTRRSSGTDYEPTLRAAIGCLLAAGLLAAATLSVVAVGGAAAADGPKLETALVTVADDETATLTVTAADDDPFAIRIGDEAETGYELRASVEPNGEETVALTVDPAAMGAEQPALTAAGDAAVTTDAETDLGGSVDPAEYPVELYADSSVPDDGEGAADIGTLVVDADADADDPASESDESDGEETEPTPVSAEAAEAADLTVEPEATAVSVPVDAADAERVRLRVRSAADAATPFVVTETTAVEDGAATATVDLSRASHGDRATLRVANEDGDRLNEFDVLVVDEEVGVAEATDDGEAGEATDDEPTDGEAASAAESPGFGLAAAVAGLLATLAVARRRA